ncbi:MAG: transporter substrate-binding domain-containing protein [Ruminococcaceae bacterium]|nr:transporter substrate-binding domain-containing protein [Oscillospiraceae bacterium]
MKKIIAMVLVLVMMTSAVFTMSSCAKEDNVLVCGVTIIPGLNEKDENDNWIGFESEFAMEVGKIIGMEVKFQEIEWSQKYNELNAGAIDCVWNGFTANSYDTDPSGKEVKRSDLVDFSYGYMLNQQCIVVKSENKDNYTTEESLKGKTVCVEGGSAGEAYAKKATDADKVVTATAQIKAFTEVKSGAVDFIVVDIVLAQNLCGKGDYADLAIVDSIELESEIYAVGFKKGSELTAKVNAAIKELEANGKLMEIAKEYGFENVIKVTETIE